MDKQLNGECFRATVIECLQDNDENVFAQPDIVKFRCKVNGDLFEETLTYQVVLDYVNNTQDTQIYWKLKIISGHDLPLSIQDKEYQGSRYDVMVEWESGEITS